ncbi:DUF2283 domain-containing protein [Marinivivus vitaminiproducens]|uniref:DUF2283 domain-containing protein n=1 Tax=Marinivivus vitaminiproducens TaxID=3035935 RepID=UPI0027A12024|nr:DUF2283 domain-containing protein [Geminicoccaceae bacterium SCSIO 64248]
MRSHYDPEVDAFAVHFTEASVVKSEEVAPGGNLDFDVNGTIVGIEILNLSSIPDADKFGMDFRVLGDATRMRNDAA